MAQQASDSDELFQRAQLLLQPLERRWHGAALGFALRQGIQCFQTDCRHGIDLAAAEAVVLKAAVSAQLQGHRQGCLHLAHLEGTGLGQGWTQQR